MSLAKGRETLTQVRKDTGSPPFLGGPGDKASNRAEGLMGLWLGTEQLVNVRQFTGRLVVVCLHVLLPFLI